MDNKARMHFKERLASGQTMWIPGSYDVLSARLIEGLASRPSWPRRSNTDVPT